MKSFASKYIEGKPTARIDWKEEWAFITYYLCCMDEMNDIVIGIMVPVAKEGVSMFPPLPFITLHRHICLWVSILPNMRNENSASQQSLNNLAWIMTRSCIAASHSRDKHTLVSEA